MNWQQYEIILQMLSPLHIGRRRVSNLQQTRGYLPGKNIWAALTARLTCEAGEGANSKAYQEMGKLVQETFRFAYFYPALQSDSGYTAHYPWQDDFDYLFLDSYASAALDYARQSAADGLLHETEFIAPCTRDGRPVYLKGCLYVQSNLDEKLKYWQDALHKLQFGGERGYGWGRVKLVSCDRKESIEGDKVQLKIAPNDRITAHLRTINATGVAGPIEPVIGWERNHDEYRGKNWRLSPAIICYTPGAKVEQPATFIIGRYGHWEQVA